MPTISISTLQFAIAAVAREIVELQQAIDAGDAVPEDYQRIDDLGRMADELEAQYDEVAKTVLNLAPYDELVGAETRRQRKSPEQLTSFGADFE